MRIIKKPLANYELTIGKCHVRPCNYAARKRVRLMGKHLFVRELGFVG